MRRVQFDVVRAIAILFVIFIHSMGRINNYEGMNQTIVIARSLYDSIIHAGVPLFVMLSGKHPTPILVV